MSETTTMLMTLLQLSFVLQTHKSCTLLFHRGVTMNEAVSKWGLLALPMLWASPSATKNKTCCFIDNLHWIATHLVSVQNYDFAEQGGLSMEPHNCSHCSVPLVMWSQFKQSQWESCQITNDVPMTMGCCDYTGFGSWQLLSHMKSCLMTSLDNVQSQSLLP